MATEDVEVAEHFRAALEAAVLSGDLEPVYPLLAPDVDGEGRLACPVHEVYRLKDSGEFAHERDRRVEVGIRDGKIGRYEMRIVG